MTDAFAARTLGDQTTSGEPLEIVRTGIAGSWIARTPQYTTERGTYCENGSEELILRHSALESFRLGHMNTMVARHGAMAGIHFGLNPPGQPKLVTCVRGAIWDVVVDLRIGSPTFGQWRSTLLRGEEGASVFIGPGLGHGYLSLQDESILIYLCGRPYVADLEHSVNPWDGDLNVEWPTTGVNGETVSPISGKKDRNAPSLKTLMDGPLLPRYHP